MRLLIIALLFAVVLVLVVEGLDRTEDARPERRAVTGPASTETRPSSSGLAPTDGLEQVSVIEVVDGDTVNVVRAGKEERVRLIGINAPESPGPYRDEQCFGVQASEAASVLMEGERLLMEADPSQGDRDRFDRLLRYLWLPDGRMVNLELLRLGAASEYTVGTTYAYREAFRDAQEEARQAELGLWSPDTCGGDYSRPVLPILTP